MRMKLLQSRLTLVLILFMTIGVICAEAAQVETYLQDLRHPLSARRAEAAKALGELDIQSDAVGAALGRALFDEKYSVRWAAREAIKSLGPKAKAAVPWIIDALEDNDLNLWDYLITLAAIGPDAAEAVPTLISMLQEGDLADDEARAVLMALGNIGTESKAAVPVVIEKLWDDFVHRDPKVVEESVYLLAWLGSDVRQVQTTLAYLVPYLRRRDVVDQDLIDSTMWVLEEHLELKYDDVILPALLEVLRSFPSEHKLIALLELDEIGEDAVLAAVPVLIEIVPTIDPYDVIPSPRKFIANGYISGELMLHWIIAILGDAGPQAAAAVPTLIEIVVDEEYMSYLVQSEAVRALGKIGPVAQGAVPALLQWLEQNFDIPSQLAASEALLQISGDRLGGQGLRTVTDALIDVATASSYYFYQERAKAVELLREIGPRVQSYVLEMTQVRDPYTRAAAIDVLPLVHSDPDVVLPVLTDALRDFSSEDVRIAAAYALAGLGVDAAPALDDLREMLQDESYWVRDAVEFSLNHLESLLGEAVGKDL